MRTYSQILSPIGFEGRFGFRRGIEEVNFGQVQASGWNPPVRISWSHGIRHLQSVFILEEDFRVGPFRPRLILDPLQDESDFGRSLMPSVL
jgi:hypothetical protein